MFTHQCPECLTSFVARERKRTYCSRACQNAAVAKQRSTELGTIGIHNPPVCPCGEKIAATPANPYIHAKKYCSPECRLQYGKKKQANPENWTTKTCRNCEKEFQFRKKSQSYGYYCSNACVYKHTKTKQHIVFRDNDILLDSGWEALFFGLCKFRKLPIERWPRERGVEWLGGVWYAPDFLVKNRFILPMAVEIKGNEDPDDRLKWKYFQDQVTSRLVILDKARLETILDTHMDFGLLLDGWTGIPPIL